MLDQRGMLLRFFYLLSFVFSKKLLSFHLIDFDPLYKQLFHLLVIIQSVDMLPDRIICM